MKKGQKILKIIALLLLAACIAFGGYLLGQRSKKWEIEAERLKASVISLEKGELEAVPLDKGIGASSRRNGYHVVGEPGEGAVQFVAIDVTYGTYKCIILTVARGRLLVLLPIDVKFYASLGMQTVSRRNHIRDKFDAFGWRVVMQNI